MLNYNDKMFCLNECFKVSVHYSAHIMPNNTENESDIGSIFTFLIIVTTTIRKAS